MSNCTCETDAATKFLCDYCCEEVLNPKTMNRNKTIKTTNDGITVIQCEMCEQYVKTEFQGHDYPIAENGSQITIHGGYGEFYDPMKEDQVISLTLCHDCTLSIFRMIPKLKDKRGHHSVSYLNKNYPLCCEYSWTIDKETGEVIDGTKDNYSTQETFKIGE